ncbi:MAG: 4Fe-4S cluster-binding domain-containing protein [Legionella sp.]|uniref:radical SAM protein n=1 Tax=Legionella sp. TaxID=459 RepID=UPI00284E697A|nr:4Fe-4S cluster-binding domain-containing protein [Legionella sp.]
MNTTELPFSFGDLSQSNYIWLTLTNLCNIHCKYCFNYVHKNNEHMPTELTLDIIKAHLKSRELEARQKFQVVYFGGEPTVNQNALLAAVDFFIEEDIDCQQYLMTNSIFNQHVFNNLLSKNIDFQISYDGAYGNLRFRKNSKTVVNDEVINTIKRLTDANESVKIRATIHKENVAYIPELVQACASLQINKLMCAPTCDFGDNKINAVSQADAQAYVESMQKAYDLSRELGVNLEIQGESYFRNGLQHKMEIPFVWLPDGFVAMTITYATSKAKGAEKIIIGNLSEGQIKLNQPLIETMKNNFAKNVSIYCADCPIQKLCRGTIHFTPFATDTFVPERDGYFCEVARNMVRAFPQPSPP